MPRNDYAAVLTDLSKIDFLNRLKLLDLLAIDLVVFVDELSIVVVVLSRNDVSIKGCQKKLWVKVYLPKRLKFYGLNSYL